MTTKNTGTHFCGLGALNRPPGEKCLQRNIIQLCVAEMCPPDSARVCPPGA